MKATKVSDGLKAIYGSYKRPQPDDMIEYYDKWASTYDADVTEAGWIGWRIVVDNLLRLADLKVGETVLDYGCGSGMAGQYLRSKNPSIRIIGADVSPAMLDLARLTEAYAVLEHISTSASYSGTGQFSALMCSGVFTHAHIGAGELLNLLSALSIGGYASISARESYCAETDLPGIVNRLDNTKYAVIDEQRGAPYQVNIKSPEALGAYWVIQRLA